MFRSTWLFPAVAFTRTVIVNEFGVSGPTFVNTQRYVLPSVDWYATLEDTNATSLGRVSFTQTEFARPVSVLL